MDNLYILSVMYILRIHTLRQRCHHDINVHSPRLVQNDGQNLYVPIHSANYKRPQNVGPSDVL